MYEREIPLEYYTERGVEPPGLSFTGADMAEWDDDDRESAKLAMEIDMHDRWRAQEEKIAFLQEANADLLRQLSGEPRCDVCNEYESDVDGWCGECGCCTVHCQDFEGCGASDDDED